MIETLVTHPQRTWNILLALLGMAGAGAAGYAIGYRGSSIAIFAIALFFLAVFTYLGPFFILMVFFAAGPFTTGQTVLLGPSTPDLSLERVLIPLGVAILLPQWMLHRRKPPSLELEDVLLILFVTWGAASVLLMGEADISARLHEFSAYLLPIGAYLITKSCTRSERSVRVFMLLAVLLLLVLSIVVPFESASGFSVTGLKSEVVAGVVRAQSFFRSAWEFGTVAAMLLALSLHSLYDFNKQWIRRLGRLAFMIGLLAVALSFMRSAWLGSLLVLVILIWQMPRYRIHAALVLLTVALLIVLFLPDLMEMDVWTGRIAQIDNITNRTVLMQGQWALFLENPLFGIGLGQIGSTLFNRDFMSHNLYLSHLISFGLPGSFYFAAIGAILVKALGTYRSLPRGRFIGKELVTALWGATSVYLIAAASFETRLFLYMNIVLWIVLGVLSAVRKGLATEPLLYG